MKIWVKLQEFWNREEGMGTIEIVLIIVILIALVLMFRNTVVDFVSDILEKISSQGAAFDPGSIAK